MKNNLGFHVEKEWWKAEVESSEAQLRGWLLEPECW